MTNSNPENNSDIHLDENLINAPIGSIDEQIKAALVDGVAAGKNTILVVEDETILRETMAELLTDEGYQVTPAENGEVAYKLLLEQTFDIVLSDVRMPKMDGVTLLGHIKQLAPQTPVIIITAYGTVEHAVEAMHTGAFDYMLKPVNFDDVLFKVKRALQYGDMSRVHHVMTEQLAAGNMFHDLVGNAPCMDHLFNMVRKLSTVKSNVLIIGDSGTGKELFARAIHYNGITRDKPFVAVNCGAIPESLIESELFGYRRGAFTGATRDKIGYFEAANHGTLFLDELSTLPMSVQSTLLRILEERVVTPVGDTQPRPIDVRVVAASNQKLEEMVAKGEFREDLLYRLNVVKLELPPLRQRKEDIPKLVHHFLEKYMKELNKNILGISNDAMRGLLSHQWRGNVRELQNVIERAVIFAEDRQIEVEDLPFAVSIDDGPEAENLKDAVHQFERQHIIASLRRCDYDKSRTAQKLGIGMSSLYRKLDELAIPKHLLEPPASKITEH